MLLICHNLHILNDVLCKKLEHPSNPWHISVHVTCLHPEEGGIFAWGDNWWLQRPSHSQHHKGRPQGPIPMNTQAHN